MPDKSTGKSTCYEERRTDTVMEKLVHFCTTGSLHYDSQVTRSEYGSFVGITLCVSCARLLGAQQSGNQKVRRPQPYDKKSLVVMRTSNDIPVLSTCQNRAGKMHHNHRNWLL